MKESLEKAVKALAEKAASNDITPIEAMQLTQAALNAMNALQTRKSIDVMR